jgi:hypothetical protein
MDINAILDNGGYDVRNPNYDPKTKKGRAEQPYLKSSNIDDVHPFIQKGYGISPSAVCQNTRRTACRQ